MGPEGQRFGDPWLVFSWLGVWGPVEFFKISLPSRVGDNLEVLMSLKNFLVISLNF